MTTSRFSLIVLVLLAMLGSGVVGGIVGASLGTDRSAALKSALGQSSTLSVEEESQTTTVVDAALPAVVSIVITKELQQYSNRTGPNIFPFDNFFQFGMPQQPVPQGRVRQQVGGGSGFIVGSNGLILTNRHVVSDPDAEYTVVLNDGRKLQGTVLARDTINDLGIIKIDAKDLPTLKLGNSDTLKIGQSVIAIGYTLSEYKNTVTKGVISGIGRRVVAGDGFQSSVLEGAIQTDAAINPGNSGGPLLDLSGAVIGINTAVNREGQLIGFAIPVNEARFVIESVEKNGRIVRAWLGVRYVIITKEFAEQNKLSVDFGVLVLRGDQKDEFAVMPGSPADKAGLQENDIILEADGKRLDETNSLSKLIANKQPREKIELKISRKGEEKKIIVTLEERKQS
ncbi:MAG: trypsin-like peptidase domain-containing protein [bacterium]|nr:trypsin-like peptidase domain-containing protein [bacterium]